MGVNQRAFVSAEGQADLPPGLPGDLPTANQPEARPGDPSLVADLEALFTDGKTYLEAELAYQKSRAGFAGSRLKLAAIYGAAALGLLHLASIALVVGLVIALTPLVGPWLATAIVVAALGVVVVVLLVRLRSEIDELRSAFGGERP